METVTPQQFGDGQQQEVSRALEAFMLSLISAAPKLGPHILSGGIFTIQTMSGMQMKLGFAPQRGGLITPGGIRPAGQNGRIIQ